MQATSLSITLALAALMAACGDPYTAKLPINEVPTLGQAEKLAEKLPQTDRDLFMHWVARRTAAITYGGEPSAVTVSDALRNQAEYIAKMAELAKQEAAEQAKKRQAAAAAEAERIQHAHQVDLLRQHRQAVNEAIGKAFKIEALSYRIDPLFDRAGQPIAYEWKFQLRLTNLAAKEIIGAAGYVTVRDAFGTELGVFPTRLEYRVPGGKSALVEPVLRMNVGDPLFRVLREVQTLFPHWFMESIAFADGQRIDETSIPKRTGIIPAARPTS